MTLVITRGLPGSGKTTLARGWVDGYGGLGRVRVNRDDLRLNLFGAYWGLRPDQEDAVTVAQVAAVRALLLSGASVIVDDTNLRPQDAERWETVAREVGVPFEIIEVATPVEECVRRDAVRAACGERAVGESVIRQMAERYGR